MYCSVSMCMILSCISFNNWGIIVKILHIKCLISQLLIGRIHIKRLR